MDFRRSGQLDERRRRVLMDEIATPSDPDKTQTTSSSKGPVRAYNESVLSDRQKRVSDFVPLRPFAVIAAILLMLTAVAAIEALYIFATPPGGFARVHPAKVKAVALAAEHPFAAVDLRARGNLASWFSSLLFAGGVACVYGLLSIRAHRVDDYRGRYRVWWWVGAALAWASIDTATGLHEALGQAVQLLAGDKLPGGRTLLWVGTYGLVFGTLALRASLEIWASLASVVAASIAALLYFAGIAVALEMIPLPAGHVLQAVIGSSLTLVAHVSLVTSVMLYARHVHFDAQGRLLVNVDAAIKPKKKPKSKAKLAVVADDDSEVKKPAPAAKEKKEAEKKETDKKDVAPAAKPAAAGLKFGAAAPTASASISSKTNTTPANFDDEDEDEDEDDDSMSKSERRRLKKLARREGGGQQRRAA
ncbi:hypothetical protein NA78x_006044 [Anatilimnocola sp. NA78]|uniref:hypothetical protein n=1 Tax=Anatilimnocola sp. NA78 TaxID=3415683 RepID=UPI003CE52514